MNNVDRQYLELCQHILNSGVVKEDRTGTGTVSVFGTRMEFDLSEGFPLLTTKRVPFKTMVKELLWFVKGNTNIRELVLNNCNIWNKDAHRGYCDYMIKTFGEHCKPLSLEDYVEQVRTNETFANLFGDLGQTYGYMWRKKGNALGIDQLADVINAIKNNPDSRRIMVVSWDASTANNLILPPCHPLFQFYVSEGKLSCQFYMRSSDAFLGLPLNIASYALLTMLIAKECDLELGSLIYVGGDTHIYSDHVEQIKLQLTREARNLPTVILNPDIKSVFDYTIDDFTLVDYDPHPTIKGEMST